MCEFMYVSCDCCQKVMLKKYKDVVCSNKKCFINRVSNYYSGTCKKCTLNCIESVCNPPHRGACRIVITNIEKTKFEKIMHFLGIEHFMRYRNSNFKGVQYYVNKRNRNSRLIYY